jgi:hypothetical protein
MKNHVIEALKKAGWSQEAINKLIAANQVDKPEDDLLALADEVVSDYKKVVENELKPQIRKEETGRQRDIFEKLLMRETGMTEAEMKEKFPDEKDRTPKLVAHLKEVLGQNKDKTAQELQSEVVKLKSAIKEYEEVKIPGIRKEIDNQKYEFTLENKLNELYSTATEYIVPIKGVTPAMNVSLRSKYDIKLNDKGEVQFFKKGTEELAMNADRSKILDAKEIIIAESDELGFTKKSNGAPPTVVKVEGTGNPPTNRNLSAHLGAAEQHQAELEGKK